MKSYEVVAWLIDGALYCTDHASGEEGNEEITPVFAGEEGWQDHVCDTCVVLAIEAGEPVQTLGEST